MGSFASPERVESALRRREQGIEAFVQYRLPTTAFQRALGDYKATYKVQGMELGRTFPLLESTIHSDAEIVVLAVDKGSMADTLGVRAGDFVSAVAGSPIGTVDALTKQLGDEWARTAPGTAMTIEIESAGAKRSVRFTKPQQKPN
jgi:C-terminal processing protease CtpA/Prc